MMIAIDGRELCGRPTGVGRYLACLLAAWDRSPAATGHRFVLYVPAIDDDLRRRTTMARLPLSLREVPGRSGTWWEQVSLPAALRRDRPDCLFSPAYTSPIVTSAPAAVTLHDLSFVAYPEWFPPVSRVRRRAVAMLSARRARVLLTDSAFSAGEVVRLLGVPRAKVRVIPLGLAAMAPRAGLQPCSHPVVLFVGSIFNRRHLPELIRAFALVAGRRPGMRLEIVGDNRTYPAQDPTALAAEAGVAGLTTVRSYVPDDTLASLYAEAGVFAFLSDYEGFGLTPLEALQAGVPILVGDTPVAREVYGDAALFVPTTDVGAIASGLERLLFDREAANGLLARAPSVLARYSWERAGRETLDALVEAGRG
jgi:glycosyltransferase involved in cell wall biosynthesis